MYWIIFIVTIMAIIIFITISKSKKENFNTYDSYNFYNVSSVPYPKWQGELSQDCSTEKLDNCLNFSNCGICNNKCVFGDEDGPLFTGQNCNNWLYSNYRDRKIFNEKVTRVTPSWSTFYPDYEATFPSPISRATL